MKFASGLLAIFLIGAAASAEAKDCRVPHVEGKHLPRPPSGCELPPKPSEAGRLRQQNGFVDLGNGTQVRISGRVRLDVGARP
jgi:hypothetical protein